MKPSEMRRMSRMCECVRCFYCDDELGRHEHDHFPVPRSAGGTQTVPACLDCHDHKDRISLNNWDLNGAIAAVHGLIQGVELEHYSGLRDKALLTALWNDPLLREAAVLDRWSTLTPVARVLYGKLCLLRYCCGESGTH